MFMDKDTPMSEPEDNLEKLFAAEEAAIKDDGFTAQVMQDVKSSNRWRRPAIFGAGFIGAGFALGGLTELSPRHHIDEWIGQARAAVDASLGQATTAVGLAQNSAGNPDVYLIGAAVVIAAVSCFFAALSLQTR
jgi:hypothetical protein